MKLTACAGSKRTCALHACACRLRKTAGSYAIGVVAQPLCTPVPPSGHSEACCSRHSAAAALQHEAQHAALVGAVTSRHTPPKPAKQRTRRRSDLTRLAPDAEAFAAAATQQLAAGQAVLALGCPATQQCLAARASVLATHLVTRTTPVVCGPPCSPYASGACDMYFELHGCNAGIAGGGA